MFLIRRHAIHPAPCQDAVHRGASDLNSMEPKQISRDPGWPEVIVLAQIEDLADHIRRGRSRRPLRRPGAIAQARVAVLGVAPLPLVERFSRNPEATADLRHISLARRLL
jgi:hypothetical protein